MENIGNNLMIKMINAIFALCTNRRNKHMKTKHVMKTTNKIYVAGHDGLVGSAIICRLKKSGFDNMCTSILMLGLQKQKTLRISRK